MRFISRDEDFYNNKCYTVVKKLNGFILTEFVTNDFKT